METRTRILHLPVCTRSRRSATPERMRELVARLYERDVKFSSPENFNYSRRLTFPTRFSTLFPSVRLVPYGTERGTLRLFPLVAPRSLRVFSVRLIR